MKNWALTVCNQNCTHSFPIGDSDSLRMFTHPDGLWLKHDDVKVTIFKYYNIKSIYHTLDANSENTQYSGESHPGPARYYHLTGAVTESSKGHSIVPSNQVFQSGEEHGKTREFGEHITCLCLQGLLRPNHIYSTSTWWWSVPVHIWLYGLVGQITPSSWWTAQGAW